MTTTTTPTTPVRTRRAVVVSACLAVTVASLAGVLGLWAVFVATRRGQLVDAAAVEGAVYGQTELWRMAERVLDVVSVSAIAVVLVVAMGIAVVRRRWELAVQVAVVMVGANLTTQVLKYLVLPRPDHGVAVGNHENTLPSGHTTAATSIAVVLLLVVPARMRPLVAVVGAAYAAATGVSTLVGQWHRPSDVLAAVLVVLAWTAATCALTALWPARLAEDAAEGPPPSRRLQRGMLVVLWTLAVLAGAAAVGALSRTWQAVPVDARTDLLWAYGGGVLGTVAACAAAFATALALRDAAGRRLRSA
ncbi:phosphatase PAP2 family protein [Cellulomonas palmilytica]|uniref:phosphatase PAP2 family protein n=1 Tax=Cellulomonas palmilytica TaxID=2608402 RepID=UPI001F32B67C|nr:phosphatase PAP2 family protein [Cellulomonas palmilytica]